MRHESPTQTSIREIFPGAEGQERAPAASLVGECVDPRHPTLQGRVLIRWQDTEGGTKEHWLPTLQGTVVREGDRVLMLRPGNWEEALVVGVVDGFAQRPEYRATSGPSVQVEADEVVSITSADGMPLLQIRQGPSGPEVRVISADVNLEVPGRLRMTANEIELKAKKGSVKVSASDDVLVEGELIKLN